MPTQGRYAYPTEGPDWNIASPTDAHFNWEYQDGDDALLKLYAKGKQKQWDAADRIDWSLELDPENPEELPDESIPLFGSAVFDRLTRAEKANLRRHFQSWQLSQFLHGEQGALICTAKIVQQVPRMDAKFYAATQVIDEARHVEAYSRLLHDKFELAYPITPTLKRLLDNVLSDRRWDMTYLGMQILIEGLALAAFAQIRDQSKNPLAASVNAYVMQDEARHVAFGRFALRDYYPTLTQAERDEREEFAVEACYLMRDRFQAEEVWATLGLPVDECAAYMLESGFMKNYRTALFSRIVPTMKDIGLWGPKIRKAYQEMGIMGYADIDATAMGLEDERVAEEFDARRQEIAQVDPLGMIAAATLAKIPVERAWLGAAPGTIANPTAWLLVAALTALAGGTWGYAVGALPVWVVVPLHATALYVIFTPLHESMHGVAHADSRANEWIGRVAGACLTVSLPLFRAVHFEHHSHTNDPVRDPDHVVARTPRWLLPLWCLAVVTEYRRHFYGRRRWRSARDRREAVAYEAVLFAAIVAAWWSGHVTALVALWIAPALLALLFLAFAFDFLPHYPYDTREPYFATRVYGGPVLNVILLAQNQHLIHHLWTTIPWFRYRAVFRQIEADLVVRGCRIGWRVSPLPVAIRQEEAA